MSFDSCAHLWNPHLSQDAGCFYHLQKIPFVFHLPASLHIQVTTDLLFVAMNQVAFCINGIIHLCLGSFTRHNGSEISPCCCMSHRFILIYCWVDFYYVGRSRCVYPFICWWAAGLFPDFNEREESCCEHSRPTLCVDTFSFIFDN